MPDPAVTDSLLRDPIVASSLPALLGSLAQTLVSGSRALFASRDARALTHLDDRLSQDVGPRSVSSWVD